MKKRILSLLLCLVMVVSLLPVTAHAANVNMNTYTGNRITEIVIKASVNTSKAPGATNSYTESRNFVVGTQVVDVKFNFEVESLNYKTSTGGTSTMTSESGAFPIGISVGPYYYDANNKKWGSVISYVMPNYLAGQYCYDVSAHVETKKLNDYRIDPNVKVTINWYGSGKAEDCTVNFWACNEDDRSIVTAKTAPFTITDNGPLKLTPSLSIPSGYAKEAIKSFSVASWASGGQKPYTFSWVSGPVGINVNSDGTVSGAPTTACTTAQELKIKVTDSAGTEQIATIKVAPVKAERTVIKTIKIAGLSYPRVGDVVPKSPSVYVTEINGGTVSLENSPIYLAMRFWKDDAGEVIYNALEDEPNAIHTFIDGKEYVFNMQVRLEGEETCAQYRLAEDLEVIVPSFTGGAEGHNTLTKTNQTNLIEEKEYAYLSVSSPEWVPVNTGNTLTGTISYSGAARYGQKLTANVTDLPEGVSESRDLSYQWQYKAENGIWYDIYHNDTGKSITLNDALGVDKLVGRDIRVTVRCTGTNYAGTLFGAPVTVQKNWNMAIPVKPEIEYDAVSSKLTITDASWIDDTETNPQEYAWTTSLTRDETTGYAVWPTDSTVVKGTDKSLSSVTAGQTYYVYTRVKGSETMEAGRIISAVAYTVPFADGSSSGGESEEPTIWATDMVYPDYDSKTLTIYLKKGEQITVRYQLDPNNANANLPQWKGTYDVIKGEDVGDVTVTHNEDKSITIQAPTDGAVGTATVVAYKNDALTEPWQSGAGGDTAAGRQITVEIYDPEEPASVPFSKAYLGTTELYEGDTYEITKAALLYLPFVPADVGKNNYTLAAMFTTYGTGGSSGVITRSDTNAFVSLNSDEDKFVIKGDYVTESSVYVEFFALPDNEVTVENYGRYAIAALSVNVSERPAVPTRTATVSPNALSLLAGETYQLQAYMTPVLEGDSFTWSSDTESVVTVDSTGKVTVAAGAAVGSTATITATCGEGDAAACVITVKAPCTDHTYEYLESSWGHVKVCIFCDYSDNVILDHSMSWLESTETAGKMYGECADCGYKTDLMDIPANETPVDPTPDNPNTPDSPDNPNNPDSPSTPNRPNLPNLPDSSSGGHHSGAGRPYRPDLSTAVPEGTTAAKPNSDVKSPGTGDAGIMLYAALSLMSMTGGAWLVSKKRRDR